MEKIGARINEKKCHQKTMIDDKQHQRRKWEQL